jgi:hypothetical protein
LVALSVQWVEAPGTHAHEHRRRRVEHDLHSPALRALKALGARWNAERSRRFVPAGRELAPFAAWLPAEAGPVGDRGRETSIAVEGATSADEPAVVSKGVTLSQLIGDVAQAVA